MDKILPSRYRTAGPQTKCTSVIYHLAQCSVTFRNSGPDAERIIVEFKAKASNSILKKTKIPGTVQYAQFVCSRYRFVNQSKESGYNLHFFYTFRIFSIAQPNPEFLLPFLIRCKKSSNGIQVPLLFCLFAYLVLAKFAAVTKFRYALFEKFNPVERLCAADFSLLNLPKGKSLGRSKPATNS